MDEKIEFSENDIKDNFELIYGFYKKKEGKYRKILKKESAYKMLENMCRNKSSGEVQAVLEGCRGLPPYILPAKFADRLMTTIVGIPNELPTSNANYDLVHAIAPYILDLWNTTYSHSIFVCYFKNMGSLKCPTNKKELFLLWNRAKDNYFQRNISNVILDKCLYCFEPIYNSHNCENRARCSYCAKFFHIDCTISDQERCTNCS